MADRNQIFEAVTLTKDYYFKECINSRGKFIYDYHPAKELKKSQYNMLRHAGTVYSMLEVFELTEDQDLLNKAEKGLDYLIDRIEDTQTNDAVSKVLVQNDRIKLGGNGLSLIALAKYSQMAKTEKYLPLMRDLGNWILQNQRTDGWFPVHKQFKSTGEVTDFESRFYPGEAILGLVRLYELDQNSVWLDAAEKAADYIIQVRDKDEITPDHWFMYALNDLHRFRGKQDYLSHSLKMAEGICQIQIRNHPEKPEWDGGYIVANPPPKSTQAACYSEGLSASYKLIRDFGSETEKEELGKIKQTISRGIDFQLQMQVKTTERFNQKWLGGIQKSPEHEGIRIDYTQHNISSFILFYNILIDDEKRKI